MVEIGYGDPYLREKSAWWWSRAIMRSKVVQSVFIRIAVAEGDQAGESLEKPWICGIYSLVQWSGAGKAHEWKYGEQ